MANVLEVISTRSSIRGYEDRALDEATVKTLVEAALKAPTARNEQELHVSVVCNGNPLLDEIQNDLNPNAKASWYYKASVVLFISGDDNFKWTGVDAGIACQNVHLAAASLGLGSVVLGCVDGVLHSEKMAYYNEKLGVPENSSFKIAVAVGYPTVTKEPHSYDFEKSVTFVK